MSRDAEVLIAQRRLFSALLALKPTYAEIVSPSPNEPSHAWNGSHVSLTLVPKGLCQKGFLDDARGLSAKRDQEIDS